MGDCVTTGGGCQGDADCAAEEHCVVYYDYDGLTGHCMAEPDCDTDADCGSYAFCEVHCGNGWCGGVCVEYDMAFR